MKTQAVVVATVMSVLSHYANAGGMCSSRNGTQYCTCEYDKRCVSSENGCNCVTGGPRVLPPPTPRNFGQGRPAPPVSPPNQTSMPKPPTPETGQAFDPPMILFDNVVQVFHLPQSYPASGFAISRGGVSVVG